MTSSNTLYVIVVRVHDEADISSVSDGVSGAVAIPVTCESV